MRQRAQSGTTSSIRPDIQGLRALAVAAVIGNHVVQWPRGGFVGVDIFFVISGFLITGNLLAEWEREGTISLRRFYAGRIRRIFPAAVLVLLATTVTAHFLFNQTRAIATAWDAVSAIFIGANWRFAALGTDYFHATDPASPLQHFWSLSVEEQFYLAWPALVALLCWLLANRVAGPAYRRGIIGGLIMLITVGLFLVAIAETRTNSTFAYFSLASRAWELSTGALVAAAAPLLSRLPVVIRFIGGWAGLFGVVASAFLIEGGAGFPGPSAALPVGAAALVLAAGIGGGRGQRILLPIANPLTSYVGNISYSLYLWHFPVVVFAAIVLADDLPYRVPIVLGLVVALSMVGYYLVEQPFHHSPLLQSFPGARGPRPQSVREARATAWQAWRDRVGSQVILALVGFVVVVTVVVFAVGTAGVHKGETITEPGSTAQGAAGDPAANPEIAIQADLAAAVASVVWPDNLSPSIDDAMAVTSSGNPARECFDIGATPDFDDCTWGNPDAPHQLFLVGDSTALSYAPAFAAIAESSDGQWKATAVGLYGCRFTDVLVANDGAGVMDACSQRKNDVAEKITAIQPQLVVVSNAFALGQSTGGQSLSVADIVASTVAETAKYNSAGRVVYLAPPPLGGELSQCYSPASSPQACTTAVSQTWQDFASATASAAATDVTTDASAGPGNHYVSSLAFSCIDGICPAFAGTTPTKYDSTHLTVAYATRIAPAIQYALTTLGLF